MDMGMQEQRPQLLAHRQTDIGRTSNGGFSDRDGRATFKEQQRSLPATGRAPIGTDADLLLAHAPALCQIRRTHGAPFTLIVRGSLLRQSSTPQRACCSAWQQMRSNRGCAECGNPEVTPGPERRTPR